MYHSGSPGLKYILIQKKEMKLLLFINNKIVYVEKFKESSKILLELINKYCTVLHDKGDYAKVYCFSVYRH